MGWRYGHPLAKAIQAAQQPCQPRLGFGWTSTFARSALTRQPCMLVHPQLCTAVRAAPPPSSVTFSVTGRLRLPPMVTAFQPRPVGRVDTFYERGHAQADNIFSQVFPASTSSQLATPHTFLCCLHITGSGATLFGTCSSTVRPSSHRRLDRTVWTSCTGIWRAERCPAPAHASMALSHVFYSKRTHRLTKASLEHTTGRQAEDECERRNSGHDGPTHGGRTRRSSRSAREPSKTDLG